MVHGQEFDSGDAEGCQVRHNRRVRKAGVGALLVGGHVGVQASDSFDVRFVDDGVRPCDTGGRVVAPLEVVIDDNAEWNIRC